jgi:tetratricopeptide (TPR) repeat protein
VLIYNISLRLFSKKVAVVSSLFASIYGMLIYFDCELLIPVLVIFLNLLLMLLLIQGQETLKYKWWFLSGLILGLSALARPNILIFLPVILIYIIFVKKTALSGNISLRIRLVSSLYLIVGVLLLISPVTIRNYIVGKDFVPISSQAGINFYIGNNSKTDGITPVSPAKVERIGKYKDNIWVSSEAIAQETLARNLKPSEISSFWFGKGFEFIRTSPSAFVILFLKKIYLFFGGFEISNNKDIYFITKYSSLLRILIWRFGIFFPFGVLSPLALVGMIFLHRDWKKLFLIYGFIVSYIFSIVIFFVCSRFRMPVIPFLIMFASAGLFCLIKQAKEKNVKILLPMITLFLTLLLLLNIDFFYASQYDKERTHYFLGLIYQNKGKLEIARNEYEKAIKINPNFADAYNNLGNLYIEMKEFENASIVLKKAIKINPNFAIPHNNLGKIYLEKGEFDKAEKAFEKAISITPNLSVAHYNLGLTYIARLEYKKAVDELVIAVNLSPEIPDFHNNLGLAYIRLKQYKDAEDAIKEALRLKPDYSDAYNNLGSCYARQRDYKKALNSFKKAIEIDPHSKKPYFNLGSIYLMKGEITKAISEFNSAVKIDPDYELAHLSMGNAYMRNGDKSEALKEFLTVLKINPQNSEAKSSNERSLKSFNLRLFSKRVGKSNSVNLSKSLINM